MKNSFPKIIYKYRSWTNQNHKNILLKNQVYMASPKDFNDPFDCRITKNYSLLDSPEKIHKYINDGIKKHKYWLISNRKDIKKEKQKLFKRLEDIKTYQKERDNLEYSEIDKRNGVLSMSGRWNSILMWSHYGDNHNGFCIGFNELKMRSSGLFHRGGNVNYSKLFPELNPLSDEKLIVTSFYQIQYKSKEWEYEEEYRLSNFYYPDYPLDSDRIIQFPEDFVEEINLGMNISEEHKYEIIEICKKRKIKVFQIFKTPFKFDLKRSEL